MKRIDPFTLDFVSLNTLCLVHAKRSFSAAADALRTNQSTVSYTIDRLRRAFDDQLFVRLGGKTEPTPRCDALVIEARLILDQFGTMVRAQEFDPATAKTTLRISSNYYERVVILPRLIRAVRKTAPGVHILMVPAQNVGSDQLQSGQADLLLSPATLDLKAVYAKSLLKDRYVCLVDKTNPLATGPFTEPMFRGANHAYVSYAEIWRSDYGATLRRKGVDVNRALSIASPENLVDLLEGTDMIAAVPARIADKANDRLAQRECPFSAPFDVAMYWTARTQNSKMHIWLRDLIVQVTSEITASEN